MTEQDIVEHISEAETDYKQASLMLTEAKKRVVEIETRVIEVKLRFEKYVEMLRVSRNSTPQPEILQRDSEIEDFRISHPELVAMAKERDANR